MGQAELEGYQFPARPGGGLLLGLSGPRLATAGAAGLWVAAGGLTAGSLAAAVGLLAAAFVRVKGRVAVEWLPLVVRFGWAMATRNNEFYTSPDLRGPLPDPTLDLPGELFGIELHDLTPDTAATSANPTRAGYGVLRDVWRHRVVAVAEVSGEDFLFSDPDVQQARLVAWGALLDHVAQTMPELGRLQLVHCAGPASVDMLARHHRAEGGRGTDATAASYRQVLARVGRQAQEHRLLLAVAVDVRAVRRAVRQAGGGIEGAARVLMDRAARVEEHLVAGGLQLHGWLPARTIAQVLRVGFDPAARQLVGDMADVADGAGVDPAACGPWGMVDGWSAVRHDSGWSTTFEVVRPPSRQVTGDFLQHLLVGVPAQRRMSMLLVPQSMTTAERRVQSRQIAAETEERARIQRGFASSARRRREHGDAARQEQQLVAGRAMYRLVWLLTVTAATPAGLETAVGQVEAAGRRCGLELRRMAGMQRQAAGWTLPLCRGAR